MPRSSRVKNRAQNTATPPTPAPRKRVRGNAELRREQILEEAIRLIGRRGYFGFSIHELAQLCQLTNAGLLYYFGSKDKLLIALLEDRDRRDVAAVVSAMGQEGRTDLPKAESLSDVLDGFRVLVSRDSRQPELVRLYTILQAEALNQNHPAYSFFRAREALALQRFAGVVTRYVPKPHETARQILAMICGLELQWLSAGQDFDLVAAWDRAAALILPRP